MGLRIGKYTLLDLIGQGGMGRVYLARDTRLARPVALKILSRERMNNPRALARFRREAKVGAQLQHENLVRIYDDGEALGVHFLVMEYIEGKTVGKLIADQARLAPAFAASIVRQVAFGLQHLNEKGLLHRDVNPMNILVDRRGIAKLTDLGLAIDLGDAEDIVTRDGATVGTFDYISPEQARHSRSIDIRADVYSLGCTFYHMLSGHVPFPLPSLPEKLYAHQTLDPDPLEGTVPGVTSGLEEILRRMMRKLPEERYAEPWEIAKALEPFAAATPAPAVPGANEAALLEDPFDSVTAPPRADRPPRLGEVESPKKVFSPDLPQSPGPSASNLTPRPVETEPADSDPLEFISRIDFGLDQTISNTNSSTGIPRLPTISLKSKKVVWSMAGVAAGVSLLLFAISQWNSRSHVTQGASPPSGDHAPAEPSQTSDPTFTVVYLTDRSERQEPSLSEAIRRAMGRQAEIQIRANGPVNLPKLAAAQRITGNLVIRGAPGYQPELVLTTDGKLPWLQLEARPRLTLRDLKIRLASPTAPATPIAALIDASGPVILDRCTFLSTSVSPVAHVLNASGHQAEVTGCVFRGFDRPLSFVAYPKSTRVIRQCLFIRDPLSTSEGRWAIWLSPRSTPNTANQARNLDVDRCTVVGMGLVAVDPVIREVPIACKITATAVRGPSLLGWAGAIADFATLCAWTGQNNVYELWGHTLVTQAKAGQPPIADAPVDLAAFVKAPLRVEAKSRAGPVTFVGRDLKEQSPISDFAIMQDPGSRVGVEPQSVGPAEAGG
jgi:serine/threonine protein kinase